MCICNALVIILHDILHYLFRIIKSGNDATTPLLKHQPNQTKHENFFFTHYGLVWFGLVWFGLVWVILGSQVECSGRR